MIDITNLLKKVVVTMAENQEILVATINEIPGREIEQVLGETFGMTVRSRDVFKNIGAGLKSLVGGEINQYTEMLEQSREEALTRLRQNAAQLGANAVVGMRFDSDSISQDMEAITAYGTAVILK